MSAAPGVGPWGRLIAPVRYAGASHSLRVQWNRTLGVLVLVMFVGGVGAVGSTLLLVATYGGAAHRLEAEASQVATIRDDIVAETLAISAAGGYPAVGAPALDQLDATVTAAFQRGAMLAYSAAAEAQLDQAEVVWRQAVSDIQTLDPSAPVASRTVVVGHALTVDAPRALALVDTSARVSRAQARVDLAGDRRVADVTVAGLALFAAFGLGMMLRLGRRLRREVLRPVSRLERAAQQLAAGDLSHRAEVSSRDELGSLAESFNAMADALEGSHETLTVQANHDSLTGLANRAGFRRRVEEALSRPERRGGRQALLFVDLDDFKDVNDLLGHAAGDELLRVAARRLQDALRPGDLVARLGGDEFAVLLDGIPDVATACRLAGRAVDALATPVEVSGQTVHVGASVGVALRQSDSTLETLMQEADMAMYAAKGLGKGRVEAYDGVLREAAVEQHRVRADLDVAVANQELVLDYQPVLNLDSGQLVGVEALVRWQHPTRGLLPPSAFIPVAESNGAIGEIGGWVLDTAVRQLAAWQRRYARPDLVMAVNVSVRQLESPDFVPAVRRIVASVGLDPATLVIEVTESMLIDDASAAAHSLMELRALGSRVAIDDFGTGYSSIGYLSRLPVDILKIDRSLVSGLQTGPAAMLLEAVVVLGRNLGLDVIPEGIEHPEDLARLRSLGCSLGQGFLLSRPVPARGIETWLSGPARALELELVTLEANGLLPAPRAARPSVEDAL